MSSIDVTMILRQPFPARVGNVSIELEAIRESQDGLEIETLWQVVRDDEPRFLKQPAVDLGDLDVSSARAVVEQLQATLEEVEQHPERTLLDVHPRDLIALPGEAQAYEDDGSLENYAYDLARAPSIELDARPPSSQLPAPVGVETDAEPTRPEVVLSRDEAYARLESATETSPVRALRTLVRDPDESTEQRLRKRLGALEKAAEGVRDRRDFRSDLKCAIVAFADTAEDWSERFRDKLPSYEDYEFKGVTTLKGPEMPMDELPWEVGSSAELDEILQTIWQPVRRRLGQFVPRFCPKTLAIAKLEGTDGDVVWGYLYMRPRSFPGSRSPEVDVPVPTAAEPDDLHRWVGVADVSVKLAGMPSDEVEGELEEGTTMALPRAFREFRSRHAWFGLRSGIGRDLHTLAKWFEEDSGFIRELQARNDGAHPKRFVVFGTDMTGNCHVFDLDRLDSRDDPLVAFWDHESRRVDSREPFWTYVDDRLQSMTGLDPELL